MKEDIEAILNEDIERTQRRIDQTLGSGHHSVYQHVHYTLVFKDIPKIIAMLINNEKPYTTSEKSARYTKMTNLPVEEKERYDNWLGRFKEMIRAEYPLLLDTHITKLAMENSRYMISVFTPTTMVYTTNLSQLNYLIEMMLKFVRESQEKYADNGFVTKLNKQILLFVECLKPFEVEGMNRKNKGISLSMFQLEEPVAMEYYFGNTYETNYWATWAQFAQAQRHRTLHYNVFIPQYDGMGPGDFLYVPPIITSDEMKQDWIGDMVSLPKDTFPQAGKILVQERGLYEHFILKCHERLCCQAQNEIMQQTKDTFAMYLEMASSTHQIHTDFPNIDYTSFKSKTQLKNIWCAGSCNNFGRRYALNRKA